MLRLGPHHTSAELLEERSGVWIDKRSISGCVVYNDPNLDPAVSRFPQRGHNLGRVCDSVQRGVDFIGIVNLF
jgi:hypothetical protein